MYYPEQTYNIKIAENPNKENFSVWFTEKPEVTVQHIFQAMGFHMRRSQKEFVAEGSTAFEFALLMKKALAAGQYPAIIPYERSYPPVRSSIDADNFAVAYFHIEAQPDVLIQEKRLLFERFTDKRTGVAGLYGLITYGDQLDSFAVPARPKVKEAKALFRSKEIVSTLPMPFGSYTTESKSQIMDLSSESMVNHEQENIDKTEHQQVIENGNPETQKNEVIKMETEKKVNSDLTSQINENVISDENLTEEDSFKSPVESAGLEDKLTITAETEQKNVLSNSGTQILESSDSETPINAVSELQTQTVQPTIEEEILKENYAQLKKISPDLKQALKQGLNYTESRSKSSQYNTISIERIGEIEAHLADLIFSANGTHDTLRIKIRLHLQDKEAMLTSWEENDEVIDFDAAEFAVLLEQLLQEYHLFEIWETKVVQDEQALNKVVSSNPSGKSTVQSISITANKSRIEDFQLFNSWEAANEWLGTITKQPDQPTNIYFSIKWANGEQIASDFELFSEYFHPQYETDLLQKAVVYALQKHIHQAEGRFKRDAASIKIKSKQQQLSELYKSIDLGDKATIFKSFFQPKIPLASLEIKSSLIPLMVKEYGNHQLFEQANDLLKANKSSKSSEEKVKIVAVWKDGTQLKSTVKLSSVPQQIDAAFWQKVIASFTTQEEPNRYQTSDDDALLFAHELPTKRAKFYYKGLLNAYWYSSDTDLQEKLNFQSYAYHKTRLAKQIQLFLNQMEEESENDIIHVAKSSPRWQLVVNFLIEFKKLAKNDENLQLALISQLIVEAINKDIETQKTKLSGLLLKIREGSETLTDLPAHYQNKTTKKPRKKASEKRIEINQAIEKLLDQNGTDRLSYSQEELQQIQQYSGYGGSKLSETNKGLLYEYYTPDELVKYMWGFAFKHGYTDGAVLEPSCGIGKFLQFVPKAARIEGYEINPYSAQIAQLLYPKAKIHSKSFEQLFFNGNIYLKGSFRTDPFQLVIGNPPYGSFSGKYAGMGEKKRTKAFTYDQYFITRGIDLLVSGGLLIMVIPQSFLDNNAKYLPLKQQLIQKAELVEARRLPHGIFEHTEVGTDIVVFRKR